MGQHARGETPNRIVRQAEGVYIVDREGKRSLALRASVRSDIGYGRKEVTDAIAAQAAELSYYHAYAGHGSEPSIRLGQS